MDTTKILEMDEIQKILSLPLYQDLIIFRLSCCCGLRVGEIAGLDVDDVSSSGKPHIRIRKEITKGKKRSRKVPLFWDKGTLNALKLWKDRRMQEDGEAFIGRKRLARRTIQYRWEKLLTKHLGKERSRQLSIHCGRHSFCSHALSAGRSLAEVKEAAGHSNIATTSLYLHAINREGIPDVFGV